MFLTSEFIVFLKLHFSSAVTEQFLSSVRLFLCLSRFILILTWNELISNKLCGEYPWIKNFLQTFCGNIWYQKDSQWEHWISYLLITSRSDNLPIRDVSRGVYFKYLMYLSNMNASLWEKSQHKGTERDMKG